MESEFDTQKLNSALLLFAKEAKRLEKAQLHLKSEIQSLKERLEASFETMEALFSHLTDALLFIDNTMKIQLTNEAFCQLFSKERENLIGKSYSEFFSDHYFGVSIEESMREKDVSKRLFLSLMLKREKKELEVILNPINGKRGGLLLLIKEVALAKQLEETNERYKRWHELHEMMGGLAHEIRNPLSGIQGFASLLLRDVKESSSHEALSSILEGTKIISRLVEDALSSCRSQRVKFINATIDSLIEETIALSIASKNEKREIRFEKNESPIETMLDADLFKCALLNILNNALEASPKGSTVTVSLVKESEWIKVMVQDRGKGLSKEKLKKLFTPFFTTKNKGTGLGLFESLKAISLQGGSIDVESEEKKGTLFIIKLPCDYAARENSHC